MNMNPQHIEYLGLALFIASEIIGMSKLRSNSLVQLVLSAAMQAFPYSPKAKGTDSPLDILFGAKNNDRR